MKKTLIVSLLAFGLLLPGANAHAVFGLGACGAAGAGGAGASAASRATAVPVSDAVVETNTTTQTTKECVLDGLAYVLSEALISAITDNIISWINSGFEGGPAYVTDLTSFLGDIADREATNFIRGSELNNVCTAFEQPVRQALARQYEVQQSFARQISCTAEGSSNDFGAFLDGDFSQGGWRAWFRLATDSQNTPIGAYLKAEAERDSRIASRQNEELQLLDYGDGFFSKRKCKEGAWRTPRTSIVDIDEGTVIERDGSNIPAPTQSSTGDPVCTEYEIVTPGTQVNSLLSKWLGISADKLAAADEIDEILNALLAQLSQQIFTSLDGLRGLSSNSSSSSFNNQSYVRNLSQSADSATIASARNVLVSDIKTAIASEETYQGLLDEIIVGYSAAQSTFENVYSVCSSYGNNSAAANATSTLNSGIIPLLTDYQNQKSLSAETIVSLNAILLNAQTATTVEELNAAGNAYQALIDSGVIHADADILFLVNERDAQQGTFNTYSAESASSLAMCGGTP